MRHVIRPAVWLSLATVAGQIVALAIQLLIASLFGAGRQMDAYLAASTLPVYVAAIAVGGLGFVLIPLFTGYQERRDEQAAWGLASNVTGVFVVVLMLLSATGVAAAHPLLRLTVPGLSEDSLELATRLARVIWVTVFFGGLVALWTGLYQARRQFAVPALVPLVGSLLILVALAGWGRGHDIRFLAIALTATSGVQACLLLAGLLKRLRFRLNPADAGLREMARLLWPLVVASIFGQAPRLVDRFVASHLASGSISHLGYGDKLASLAATALSGGIAVVIFPIFSRHAAQDELGGLRQSIGAGLRLVFVVVAIAAGMGVALARPLIGTLLQRGEFTAADTAAVAEVLPGYMVAMLAMALGNVIGRAFYALKDTRTVAYTEIPLVLAYMIYTPWLAMHRGTVGISGAVAFYWNSSLAVLMVILWYRLGRPALAHTLLALIRMGAAAVVAGAAAHAAASVLPTPWQALVVGGAVGVAAYGLLLWLLRVEEFRQMVGLAQAWSARAAGASH